MHFKLVHLLLVIDVPDSMLGIDTGTYDIAVVDDFYLVNNSVRHHKDFYNLI